MKTCITKKFERVMRHDVVCNSMYTNKIFQSVLLLKREQYASTSDNYFGSKSFHNTDR